jgi:ribosomal protein S18 acetylase RimI-like enzyme
MKLELIEKRRGDADKYRWEPFQDSDKFEPRWWNYSYETDDPWYVQALRDGIEVGRVELDEDVRFFRYYGADPSLEPNALEIQFIEVSVDCRLQGIGRSIVGELAAMHPDQTLCALSEGADPFWESLGWRRYVHLEHGERNRPLYIQQ